MVEALKSRNRYQGTISCLPEEMRANKPLKHTKRPFTSLMRAGGVVILTVSTAWVFTGFTSVWFLYSWLRLLGT
jgi:hypothetical protein